NVPGMPGILEIKNQEKEDEDEEKTRQREETIGKYYNETVSSTIRHQHNTYIFQDDELDNDNIITMVETLPTCRRTKEEVKKIHQPDSGE
ncbi:MAG: cell division protein FtsZ, partial [Bacteroidaceae bacterium]|nr:cell division protein FtsZ [Bacteroidaceae bacterium]